MNLLLQRVPLGDRKRHEDIRRVVHALEGLDEGKAWKVTIEPAKPTRTLSQNALLWKLYDDILKKGGEALAGFDKDDLHEYCLMLHWGHEVKSLFGRKRLVPLRRSSRLSKTEFGEFVDHIVRHMAEKGIVLRLPGDL